MRALVLGAVALGLAIQGQRLVTYQRDISGGARSYALGIVLLVAGWLGTYRNRVLPRGTVTASGSVPPLRGRVHSRLAIGAGAVALNFWSVWLLRSHSYASWAGGLGWLASLALFFVAFLGLGEPEAPTSIEPDPEAQAGLQLPRRVEIALATAIFALAVAMRWHRLGDWTTGMHGDEGEVGAEALRILEGHGASPFGVGWFAQPNVYYWAVALTMKVFGTGLFGLRLFALIAGSLMVPSLYLLVRRWFGVRMAILASLFLAVSDVAIHFSRQQFSNITAPLFLVIGASLFFRGLDGGRYTDFIGAGYVHSLSLYFYVGGRLSPLVLIAFVAYLFLLMPALRALASGWRAEAAVVGRHLGRIAACLVAALCMATPWMAFYADNRELWDARVAEKLIFNNVERVASASGASHEALRLLGVTLAGDGFWPRVLWSQLLATLSILTCRIDGSSVYTFTQEPIAKPLESALIVLGIAWALWRWRDARMALLSIWFWSAVLVGAS